jgi:hypothetical protein
VCPLGRLSFLLRMRAPWLVVPFVLACGGEGKRSNGQHARPADVGEFCSSLAAIVCDARERCCASAQPCEVEARADSCRDALERVLETERAVFDAEGAQRTLNAHSRWAWRCEVRVFELGGVAAVQGTVPAGDACVDAAEEISPVVCAPGTSCDPRGDAPACEPLPGEGMPCADRGPCAPGFACRDERCTEPAAVGEPCADHLECDSLHCEDETCQDYTQLTESVLCED